MPTSSGGMDGRGRDPMDWHAAIGAWRLWSLAGDASAQTLKTRTHYLRALAVANRGRLPFELTTDDLVAFLAQSGWQPETRKSARGAIRAFYRWANITGRSATDPSYLLPAVRIPPPRSKPIPPSVFAEALACADGRTRLMLQLGRFAGLRRAEIATVHTSNLLGDELRVLGKGRKIRHVPLVPVLFEQIRHAEPGWLFPGQDGGHLSPGHVGVLMSRALPEGWVPHSLRHRAGTDWYAVERDLFAVQELLGHAKADTTRIYVETPSDARRRAVLGAVQLGAVATPA